MLFCTSLWKYCHFSKGEMAWARQRHIGESAQYSVFSIGAHSKELLHNDKKSLKLGGKGSCFFLTALPQTVISIISDWSSRSLLIRRSDFSIRPLQMNLKRVCEQTDRRSTLRFVCAWWRFLAVWCHQWWQFGSFKAVMDRKRCPLCLNELGCLC